MRDIVRVEDISAGEKGFLVVDHAIQDLGCLGSKCVGGVG